MDSEQKLLAISAGCLYGIPLVCRILQSICRFFGFTTVNLGVPSILTAILACALAQNWEKLSQMLKTMVTSETFLKVIHWKNAVEKKLKKAVLDVQERFNKVDKWRRASWFFLALAWIVKSVAYLNSLSSHYSIIYFVLIQCPLIVLLFSALFLMLYLLQSVLFAFIVQHHPRTGFLDHMGAVIFQEITYRRIHNNPSSIFGFAFLQSVVILQYTSYSSLNHGLIPADFRGKREEIVQMVVLQLFQLLVRTIFNGRFLETGALMIPFLLGIFAVLHLKNVACQSLVNQILSPQVQISDSNRDEANNLEAKQQEECAEANKLEAKEDGTEASELEAKEEGAETNELEVKEEVADEANKLEAKQQEECAEANKLEAKEDGAEASELEAKEEEGAETNELEVKEEVADEANKLEAKEEGADGANIEEKEEEQEEDSFVVVESSDILL